MYPIASTVIRSVKPICFSHTLPWSLCTRVSSKATRSGLLVFTISYRYNIVSLAPAPRQFHSRILFMINRIRDLLGKRGVLPLRLVAPQPHPVAIVSYFPRGLSALSDLYLFPMRVLSLHLLSHFHWYWMFWAPIRVPLIMGVEVYFCFDQLLGCLSFHKLGLAQLLWCSSQDSQHTGR